MHIRDRTLSSLTPNPLEMVSHIDFDQVCRAVDDLTQIVERQLCVGVVSEGVVSSCTFEQ